MNKICDLEQCTACNACINNCPKGAITMEYDKYDFGYPKIDNNKCINCGICKKVCPNNETIKFNIPKTVYAAWVLNKENRNKSASGGIATCIQEYALKNNIITYGVAWENGHKLVFKRINSISELDNIRNSKYLYSNTRKIYSEIKEYLEKKQKVLFIGMPCQVAGLKSSLNKEYDNLTTIDIVCHGMPTEKYFEKHIEYIKQKKNIEDIKQILFRVNNDFDMRINSKSEKQYILKEITDPYLVGFHKGILYREACYKCNYTKKERVGDITLCDFWGLENDKELSKEIKNGISAVLINTEKGKELYKKINPKIYSVERTLEEVVKNNGQLRSPTVKPKERDTFFRLYNGNNFEQALKKSIRKRIFFGYTKYTIKKFIKKIIPRQVIIKIKKSQK